MTDVGLRTEVREAITILELSRPHKRNALDRALLRALGTESARAVEAGTRALVLTGAGGAFCAGWDLDDLKRMTPGEGGPLSREIQQTLRSLEVLPIPVIAALEGPARGGGCGLACAADIRIFAESATIGIPEALVGTIPGGGIVRRLASLVGPGVAAEMLYAGRPLDASRAFALGLANSVVPDGAALDVAVRLASELARGDEQALCSAKLVLRAVDEVGADEVVEIAAQEIDRLVGRRPGLDSGRGGDAASQSTATAGN